MAQSRLVVVVDRERPSAVPVVVVAAVVEPFYFKLPVLNMME